MSWEKYQPTIAAGAGILSNVIQNIGAKNRERRARKFNQRMEREARQHNISLWHMQNQYNHPLSQMERLQAAGLNPNLIYGSSPGSAVGNASSISPGKGVTGQAPEYRMDNPMIPFMDTKVKQAQTNNLKSQSDVNDANALYLLSKADLTRSEATVAKGTIFSNIEMRRHEADIVKERYLQEKLRTNLMSDKDVGIVAEKAVEIDKLKSQGAQEKYKARVEALNAFLAEKGIRSNDPFWARVMSLVTGMDLPTTDKEQKEFRKEFESWLNDKNNERL